MEAMGRVVLELAVGSRIARDAAGGVVFVHDCDLAVNEQCELALRVGERELVVPARVTYIDGRGGASLEVIGFNPRVREQILLLLGEALVAPGRTTRDDTKFIADALAALDIALDDVPRRNRVSTDDDIRMPDGWLDAPEPAVQQADGSGAVRQLDDPAIAVGTDRPEPLPDAERSLASDSPAEDLPDIELPDLADLPPDQRKPLAPMHERLRGLSLAEQLKKAHSADPAERMLLERMYGKSVWEALLRNQRLTPPEVSRIARMGTLPRPLLELIVGNNSWLQVPEVRRALLANPRLGPDQINRVLRLIPKHELKVLATAAAYPFAVRDAAKRLLRG
jgi:hypothetical protein